MRRDEIKEKHTSAAKEKPRVMIYMAWAGREVVNGAPVLPVPPKKGKLGENYRLAYDSHGEYLFDRDGAGGGERPGVEQGDPLSALLFNSRE